MFHPLGNLDCECTMYSVHSHKLISLFHEIMHQYSYQSVMSQYSPYVSSCILEPLNDLPSNLPCVLSSHPCSTKEKARVCVALKALCLLQVPLENVLLSPMEKLVGLYNVFLHTLLQDPWNVENLMSVQRLRRKLFPEKKFHVNGSCLEIPL